MPSFNVTLDIKDMFFDRQHVLDAVGKENAKKLSKAGAFIRQRAKTKLRRRKKPSAAGQPPSVHSRDRRATLKNILFGLNADWESVVIGPVGLTEKRLSSASVQTVPELMEYGGTSRVKEKRVRYPTHPFMGPSLEEEAKAGTIGNLGSS